MIPHIYCKCPGSALLPITLIIDDQNDAVIIIMLPVQTFDRHKNDRIMTSEH